ncbi:MAG: DUF6172 family protein [Verrucomicrobiota bacterium]
MRKTFSLRHPKIVYPRLIESAKNDVRKYIKRERRRELPKGVDFWDFDCRFGDTAEAAKKIHPAELIKNIDDVAGRGAESFYVEILAKPGIRRKRPKAADESS